MLKRILFIALFSLASLSRISLAVDVCQDTISRGSRSSVAANGYSKQIRMARQRAAEIYQHGVSSGRYPKSARPPGFSVAVAVNGKLVWAEGFGFADLEQCVPVTPETKFRIGSTSKPLTAVGAALLYEQGKLDLDAPIQRYVPSFPDKGYVITTRQLLAHLGGIRTYTAEEDEIENQRPYLSVTEGLERFKNDPLVESPGTKFSYSSYGYDLIGAAIEGASQQRFLTFMHDNVFAPLGMQDTVADENGRVIRYRARWYDIETDGSYHNSPYVDLSYKWAAGGFLSTAKDLVLFGSGLLQPGFVKQRTLTEMFTPPRTATGERNLMPNGGGYGWGWMILGKGFEHVNEMRFEHPGSTTGSSCNLIIYPEHKVVVAWLMNSDALVERHDRVLYEIATLFFAEPRLVSRPKSKVN
jgi:CubicO group peptidase (beta-lactamase class C family)